MRRQNPLDRRIDSTDATCECRAKKLARLDGSGFLYDAPAAGDALYTIVPAANIARTYAADASDVDGLVFDSRLIRARSRRL